MYPIAQEIVQVMDSVFEIFVYVIMNGVDLTVQLNYVPINVENLTGVYANKVDAIAYKTIQEWVAH